ncbi:MAG: hypothetical protein QOI20_1222 [Acidimicrobiaceae bacterium]|nr:hypothetical protein [Acidimicrobiaceae bacterium]
MGKRVAVQRALISGVAACLLLFIAPSPSRAAGVTRSAPYDFGVQCLDQDASANVAGYGDGTPYGCSTVPEAAALSGVLAVARERVSGGMGVVVQSQGIGGAVGHATVGRSGSGTGLNVTSGSGGQLRATAAVDGAGPGTRVCLTIQYGGGVPSGNSCNSVSLSASVSAVPNTTYAIQVTLYSPTGNAVATPGPCPPSGIASCTGGGSVEGSQVRVTVRSITYSLG